MREEKPTPAKRTRAPRRRAAVVPPVEATPQPDLTVSAVVTVVIDRSNGTAKVAMEVNALGREDLIALTNRHEGKFSIIGSGLRRVVMAALSAETSEPPVDMLKVGRA